MNEREQAYQSKRRALRDKKRIVIKVGSSSITHAQSGDLMLGKLERLVRVICDLRGEGREVILVSSGAIAAGRQALNIRRRPKGMAEKQAFAAVGQAKLMMTYQKLFSEYNHTAAQVLLTKNVMVNPESRRNARGTFLELLKLGAVPVVNENDTISTSEIAQVESFGDNDRLAAIVSAIIGADLLILLSDIDGLYTDNPKTNPQASRISFVSELTEELMRMGSDTVGSDVGTGGMSAKLSAARIATDAGADMLIASFDDASVITALVNGEERGTLFAAHKHPDFDLLRYIESGYRKTEEGRA